MLFRDRDRVRDLDCDRRRAERESLSWLVPLLVDRTADFGVDDDDDEDGFEEDDEDVDGFDELVRDESGLDDEDEEDLDGSVLLLLDDDL